MRVKDIINESFGVERYKTNIPLGDYISHWDAEYTDPAGYKDVADLHTEVDDLLNAGIEPGRSTVYPSQLLATQDWLDNSGGGEAFYPEYEDRPVIYMKNRKLYIIDGHHRVSQALKTNKPLPVYVFTDEMLKKL
jgi:hypothetical protein